MIPNTDNLRIINPEIAELAKEFPERIMAWKKKLQELKYVEFFVVNELPDDVFKEEYQIAEESSFYSFGHRDADMGIASQHSYSFSSFNKNADIPFDPDLVISAAAFVTKEQWARQESWFGERYNRFNGSLAINFRLGNKAEIVYDSVGCSDEYVIKDDDLLAWPKERLTFEGTWEESYNHLVKLIEEAVSLITIPETTE